MTYFVKDFIDFGQPSTSERWAIELFFRWVKQTLKIRRFLGTSENAVCTQIAVALIAFLLLRLAQAAQHAVNSPLVFARLIRANLMHRRSPDCLLKTEPLSPTLCCSLLRLRSESIFSS